MNSEIENKLKDIVFYGEHNKVLESINLDINNLIVSPTGSGKTIIILRIIDEFLRKKEGKKVLVVCPTNLLVDQIAQSFKNFSNYEVTRISESTITPSEISVCTGHRAIINYERNRWDLQSFDMVVFDEVHRIAPPNAPYARLCNYLKEHNTFVKFIGCTATLPKKIQNLVFKKLDPLEYIIGEAPLKWEKKVYFEKISFEKRRNFLFLKTKKNIYDLYSKLFKKVTGKDIFYFIEEPKRLFSILLKDRVPNAETFMIQKLLRILFLRHFYFYECYNTYEDYLERKVKNKNSFWPYLKLFTDYENEKFVKIKDLVKAENSSVIIFLDNYNTILSLKKYLESNDLENILVLGGKSKLKEKERKGTLYTIKNKEKNIILTTSVAEEGLDIGSADTVIFYRPILNEIMYTQRKGRTGRHRQGKIHILCYKNTSEALVADKIKKYYESEQELSSNT